MINNAHARNFLIGKSPSKRLIETPISILHKVAGRITSMTFYHNFAKYPMTKDIRGDMCFHRHCCFSKRKAAMLADEGLWLPQWVSPWYPAGSSTIPARPPSRSTLRWPLLPPIPLSKSTFEVDDCRDWPSASLRAISFSACDISPHAMQSPRRLVSTER